MKVGQLVGKEQVRVLVHKDSRRWVSWWVRCNVRVLEHMEVGQLVGKV